MKKRTYDLSNFGKFHDGEITTFEVIPGLEVCWKPLKKSFVQELRKANNNPVYELPDQAPAAIWASLTLDEAIETCNILSELTGLPFAYNRVSRALRSPGITGWRLPTKDEMAQIARSEAKIGSRHILEGSLFQCTFEWVTDLCDNACYTLFSLSGVPVVHGCSSFAPSFRHTTIVTRLVKTVAPNEKKDPEEDEIRSAVEKFGKDSVFSEGELRRLYKLYTQIEDLTALDPDFELARSAAAIKANRVRRLADANKFKLD